MPGFLGRIYFIVGRSDLQVAAEGSLGAVGSIELVVVAGQDGVQQDADDGGDGQTGQVDGDTSHSKAETAHRVEAHGAHQDHSSHDEVAAVGKVHPVLHHIADTDGRDHAVEHEADTADDAGRDGVDDSLKLGAEAQDDGQHSGNADHQGIVDLAEGQHAGVLAVGGVGRAAQQAGHAGSQAVAQQGAVQAGVVDIVVAHGSTDGGNVAHMLHHGSQCDGDDGEQSADELRAAVDGEQTHGLLVQGDAEPGRVGDLLEVHGTSDQSHRVGHQHTDQDGQDLDHALTPDVADNDHAQRHKGQQPVGLAVGDGRRCQDQADGDDDGAGDHRREELHDAADAKGGDEQAGHQIHQAGESNGGTGVRQHLGVGHGQVAVCISQHGSHDGKAAQVSKGGAQESRHLLFGDQVEQQRAQTSAQQRGGNAQAGEQRHQHRGAKHSKHVLHTQDQHPSGAQLSSVVYALGVIDLFTHGFCIPPASTQKKRHCRGERQCLLNWEQ